MSLALAKPADSSLDALAETIKTLCEGWKGKTIEITLDCKWNIGHEICVSRGIQNDVSYRYLEARTGISHGELRHCVKFYQDWPKKDYPLKPWRDLRGALLKRIVELPKGKYRTLVIDPPWPVEKILREVRPNQQKSLDYQTLTLDQIQALDIPKLAFDEGAHIYLWTTHRFLPSAFDVFKAWGVEYECLLTWVKNVGFTPYSFMYSTEHVLFGRIGSLDLLKKGERLDFQAKVREHSRKPDEFYELVRRVSPGPRLDMFSREPHEGFEQWGNETSLFAEATA